MTSCALLAAPRAMPVSPSRASSSTTPRRAPYSSMSSFAPSSRAICLWESTAGRCRARLMHFATLGTRSRSTFWCSMSCEALRRLITHQKPIPTFLQVRDALTLEVLTRGLHTPASTTSSPSTTSKALVAAPAPSSASPTTSLLSSPTLGPSGGGRRPWGSPRTWWWGSWDAERTLMSPRRGGLNRRDDRIKLFPPNHLS
jgi:hypothetical protein